MITAIESKHNTTLRHLARLNREKKYRQGAGEMVCEGWKMLGEALSSGVTVKTVRKRRGRVCLKRKRPCSRRRATLKPRRA